MTFDDHERARWAGRAVAYDRSFGRLCAHPAADLLDAAAVHRGTHLLDAGTGPGTVAALACARGATVVAVDPEPSMLELAATRVPDAEFRQATLPRLPFTADAFDAVVANFVVNHVGDPAASLTELRRVTRPGGRVAVTIWPAPPPTAQRLWGDILAAAGARRPPNLPRLEPDQDFARTEAGLSALLAAAGLDDLRCTTLTWDLIIDPDDWWSGPANGIAMPGLVMEHQPAGTIAHIRAVYDEFTGPYRRADGLLALPTAALLAAGTAG
ncbi:class I SAM-dependent methyltransferase [Micromonosporaceae bacterium Da 78-11]